MARATAFVDRALCDEGGRPVGLIGLFESEDDAESAGAVLSAAKDWLREQGAAAVFAPVSFSIWHSYRFRTQGHDETPYYGEPYNPKYYPELFAQCGLEPVQGYGVSSLDEKAIRALVEKDRPRFEKSRAEGFTYRRIDRARFGQELDLIYRLVVPNYRHFLAWTEISLEEFRSLYERLGRICDPELIQIAYAPDGQPAGVVIALPDLAAPIRALRGRASLAGMIRFAWRRRRMRRFIVSNVSVLDKFKGRGIGNALMHIAHIRAVQRGYRAALHGPSSVDNLSTKLHGGDYFERQYTLYRATL